MHSSSSNSAAPARVLLVGDARGSADSRNSYDALLELAQRLPDARAVVFTGPGDRPGPHVRAVHVRRQWWRFPLRALTSIIAEEAQSAQIIDADVHPAALFLPTLNRALRGKEIVVRVSPAAGVAHTRRARTPAHMRDVITRYVYRRASVVVAPTGGTGRELIERYGVSPWRVKIQRDSGSYVAQNLTDRTRARQRLSLPADAFVACYVNAPVPATEAGVLFEAWATFLDGHDPQRARLLIASAGEARGALTAGAVPVVLAPSVTVLGAIEDDALADVLSAADVNIATSTSANADAIALEAAAHGTRSIVPSDPAAERVDDDATMAVPPDDHRALARRLTTVADEAPPDRQLTRAWAARRRWDQILSEHRRLYDELRGAAGSHRLRVVYLGHVAQLSGGEIALARLIEALEDVRAHVILAEDGPLVERLQAANATVEILPLRERTRDLRKDRVGAARLPLVAAFDTTAYALRLARRIHALQPDVIHTNTLKAGVYGSLAGRLARVPVVWHVRDRIAGDYLRGPAVALLRSLIAMLPSAVIVNSEATGKTLWRRRGRTTAIPSPIADTIGQPKIRWRTYGDRFVVGMVGRIAPWKGQHVFLDAFASAFGNGDEMAIIVGAPMFGAGEADYDADLREQVAKLGMSDRVVFRGFRADVWRELGDMDVFVHASVTPEPFGQVIIEAMLAGVPVVAAAAGGPSETISDGLDGILYRPGDVDALATALRLLRRDEARRSQLAENARRRAADAVAPERVAAAVMDMYRQALAR